VAFEVECETRLGDRVVVTGSTAQTGHWRPEASPLQLTTGPKTYPRWQGIYVLEGGQQLEFKFVVLCGDGGVRWEDRIANRRLSVSEREVTLQARFDSAHMLENEAKSELAARDRQEEQASVDHPQEIVENKPQRYRRRLLEYTWPIEELQEGVWRVASYDDISSIYSELERDRQTWDEAFASEEFAAEELEEPQDAGIQQDDSKGSWATASSSGDSTCGTSVAATASQPDSSDDSQAVMGSWISASSSRDSSCSASASIVAMLRDSSQEAPDVQRDADSKGSWTFASSAGESFCDASVSAAASTCHSCKDAQDVRIRREDRSKDWWATASSWWAAASSSGDELDSASTTASAASCSSPGSSACSLEAMAFCLERLPEKPKDRFPEARDRFRGESSKPTKVAYTPWKDRWPLPPPSLPSLTGTAPGSLRMPPSKDRKPQVEVTRPTLVPLPGSPRKMVRTPSKELLSSPTCKSRNRRFAEPPKSPLAS